MSGFEHLPYRPCVGITLFNAQGLVFIGRRPVNGNTEKVSPDHAWQMPQGGIDDGEAPQEAAMRELYEETNIRSISLMAEAPDWFTYDLPGAFMGKAWKGRYRGQKQRWFAFRFDGDESEINVAHPGGGHKAEFDSWRWERLERLPDLVIPFKRGVYEQVVSAFGPVAAKLAG